MASYTLGALCDDTLDQLKGTTRDVINTVPAGLDAPAAGTIETVTFGYDVSPFVPGALIVNGEETLYSLGITNLAASQVSVIRGFEDTTPQALAANGLVVVDPPWTRAMVLQRLKEEIRSWTPQVFRVKSVDIPIANAYQRGYDLGATGTDRIIELLRVTAPQPPYIGSPGAWVLPSGAGNAPDVEQSNPEFPAYYSDNANTTEFPSGRAMFITAPAPSWTVGNYHVVYACDFDVDDSWGESTDVISAVGIDESFLDLAPLGAATRLLRMLAPRRAMSTFQGQPREAQDIRVADILQAAQVFMASRDSRYGDYQERLRTLWPYKSTNL